MIDVHNGIDVSYVLPTASLADVNIGEDGSQLGKAFLVEYADLQQAVSKGDLKAAKQEYVAMVDALEAWTKEQNVGRWLSGLSFRKEIDYSLSPNNVFSSPTQ